MNMNDNDNKKNGMVVITMTKIVIRIIIVHPKCQFVLVGSNNKHKRHHGYDKSDNVRGRASECFKHGLTKSILYSKRHPLFHNILLLQRGIQYTIIAHNHSLSLASHVHCGAVIHQLP